MDDNEDVDKHLQEGAEVLGQKVEELESEHCLVVSMYQY